MQVATMDRVWDLAPQPAPELQGYSGFPWWIGLLVEPNREQRSAEWLRRLNVFVYWPSFMKQIQRRGKAHYPRLSAVMPGLLLAPIEVMDIGRRDEVFEYAHVRGFIRGAAGVGEAAMRIPERDVECIREIEALLNLPPERKGVLFEVGQRVRFSNDLIADSWGTATILEIASKARIGVEVRKLFGRPTMIYVPASEIEAM